MSNKVLSGYVNSFGARDIKIWEHTGPSSYVTGGETLPAVLLNLMDLSWVSPPSPAWTYSGTYFVVVTYTTLTAGVTPSVTLKWYVVSTGVEVGSGVNLSAETIRLLVMGV